MHTERPCLVYSFAALRRGPRRPGEPSCDAVVLDSEPAPLLPVAGREARRDEAGRHGDRVSWCSLHGPALAEEPLTAAVAARARVRPLGHEALAAAVTDFREAFHAPHNLRARELDHVRAGPRANAREARPTIGAREMAHHAPAALAAPKLLMTMLHAVVGQRAIEANRHGDRRMAIGHAAERRRPPWLTQLTPDHRDRRARWHQPEAAHAQVTRSRSADRRVEFLGGRRTSSWCSRSVLRCRYPLRARPRRRRTDRIRRRYPLRGSAVKISACVVTHNPIRLSPALRLGLRDGGNAIGSGTPSMTRPVTRRASFQHALDCLDSRFELLVGHRLNPSRMLDFHIPRAQQCQQLTVSSRLVLAHLSNCRWTAVPEVSEQGRNKFAVQLLAVTRARSPSTRVA